MDFISQALGKSASSICKEDILNYIKNNGIQFLNLCYIGSDSRLKWVSFPTKDLAYIESVLARGERIASVFLHESIKTEGSNIVPIYRTAFLNPFSAHPTLNILCSCLNKDMELFSGAPSTVLTKAAKRFTENTGLSLNAGGELEYYVLYPASYDLFKITKKHYDATPPFTVYEDIRNEAVQIISGLGISVKYAHSESGKIFSVLFSQGANSEVKPLRRKVGVGGPQQVPSGFLMEEGVPANAEQHEIEFLPVPLCESADNMVISKWVICNVAKKYGVSVSFSPIIELGKPGTGMHFHMEIIKKGKNIVLDKAGNLSTESKRVIGGILKFAKSLCAFGNPVPVSYLRLMGKKETPYGICWSERSRKSLIRIPEKVSDTGQTIEFRASDGTAVVHLLLAGLAVAAEYGLREKTCLEIAEKLYISEAEISKKILSRVVGLPQSCGEAANALKNDRKYYEKDGIFPPELIDSIIVELKSYGEEETVLCNPSKNAIGVSRLIEKYIHYSPFSFY